MDLMEQVNNALLLFQNNNLYCSKCDDVKIDMAVWIDNEGNVLEAVGADPGVREPPPVFYCENCSEYLTLSEVY